MQVAEKLYNQGLISYPRTETDSFADGFDFRSLIETQTPDPTWGEYARSLLDGKFVAPKKGKNNDNAHPPIHPVRHPEGLGGIERDVYELVVRHFLACCSDDAKGAETIVNLDIAGEGFTCKGLQVLEYNYLDIYRYDRWGDKNIPVFAQGEVVTPEAVEMKEGTTTPPNLLTEPDLIKLMDRNGIGTDATIATHIQTIQDREYAVKEGQYFSPTNLGVALLSAYRALGYELGDPAKRAQMEADMKLICQGRKTKDEVVRDAIDMYKAIFQVAAEGVEAMEVVRACLQVVSYESHCCRRRSSRSTSRLSAKSTTARARPTSRSAASATSR